MSNANFDDSMTNMTDEKKEAKIKTETLNIKVLETNGNVLQYKINRNQTFHKLLNNYCDRANLDVNHMRFRFDGDPVQTKSTPKALGMEEGDTIEIFNPTDGG